MRLEVTHIIYLLHSEAGSNTQHVFFPNCTFKDVVAGSRSQPIFFTMNPCPFPFAVDEFFLFLCSFFIYFLFCFACCFLVDEINVRACVSPIASTWQTPVAASCELLHTWKLIIWLNMRELQIQIVGVIEAH